MQVSKSAFAEKSGGFEPVFIQSEVDADEVYVQGQLLLTVRIYYGVALSRGAQLSDLEIPNAVVKQLNESSYETRVRNMNYNVHEVKYAIFPQRSGTLEIPSQTFNALMASGRRSGSLFDNLGSARGRPVRASSETHTIDVKPKAAAFTGPDWLPAENIEIIESWSKELDSLTAGEPITRSLIVEARGLQGSQVPPLNIADLANAQQYPDQPETADELGSQGVIGTRIESEAIIPSSGGELKLPEVRLPWWNTRTDRQEVAIIPAQILTVSGPIAPKVEPQAPAIDPATVTENRTETEASLQSDSSPQAATYGVSRLWLYATWLCLILWVATVAYFMLTGRRGKTTAPNQLSQVPSRKRLEQLQTACKRNDVSAIKTGLIEWTRDFTGKTNISSLSAAATALQHDALTAEIQALDRALYQSESNFSGGSKILDAIDEILKRQDKRRSFSGPSLQPLYRA